MRKLLVSLVLLFQTFQFLAQREIVEEANIPMFAFNYAFHFPSGDMADRFGSSSMIGADFQVKTQKGWLLGVDYRYIFGGDVKDDDILDGIKTSNGNIINQYGEYATVLISERGFYSGVNFGKMIPLNKHNPNSGIFFKVGAGLLQHKINIENQSNNAPQVLNDYEKGYDRLTNGLTLNGFIGYMYIGKSQMSNFYIGVDYFHSWTESRRDFDFATMMKDDLKRTDKLAGLKLGWIIPLYRRIPDEYFTY